MSPFHPGVWPSSRGNLLPTSPIGAVCYLLAECCFPLGWILHFSGAVDIICEIFWDPWKWKVCKYIIQLCQTLHSHGYQSEAIPLKPVELYPYKVSERRESNTWFSNLLWPRSYQRLEKTRRWTGVSTINMPFTSGVKELDAVKVLAMHFLHLMGNSIFLG